MRNKLSSRKFQIHNSFTIISSLHHNTHKPPTIIFFVLFLCFLSPSLIIDTHFTFFYVVRAYSFEEEGRRRESWATDSFIIVPFSCIISDKTKRDDLFILFFSFLCYCCCYYYLYISHSPCAYIVARRRRCIGIVSFFCVLHQI